MFDSFFKWYKTEKYASAIVFAVVGLLLFLNPEYSLSIVFGIISLSLILKGLFVLIGYAKTKDSYNPNTTGLIVGLFYTLVGLLLMLNYRFLISMIPFVIGCIILLNGIDGLMSGFRLNGQGFDAGKQVMLRGGLCAALGLLLMMNPLSSVNLTIKVMGLILLVNSILEAFDGYRVDKWGQ